MTGGKKIIWIWKYAGLCCVGLEDGWVVMWRIADYGRIDFLIEKFVMAEFRIGVMLKELLNSDQSFN